MEAQRLERERRARVDAERRAAEQARHEAERRAAEQARQRGLGVSTNQLPEGRHG